jgi:non-ribosomal peptide synthetase component F
MHTDERTSTRVGCCTASSNSRRTRRPPPSRWTCPHRRRRGAAATDYADLNAAADLLAGRLAPYVNGEGVVAILLPRAGAGLFTARLAIMKAGAAWTCIEPSTPIERLRS